MSLLSRIGNTLRNDLVKPVQRVVQQPQRPQQPQQPQAPRVNAQQLLLALQANQQQRNAQMGTPQVHPAIHAAVHASILHDLTHNPVTNLVGGAVVKPVIRTSQAINQGIGNAELKLAGRPTQNAQQAFGPTINKFTGYTGTKKQIVEDAVNNVLNGGAAGATGAIEKGITKAVPSVAKIVPKVLSNAAVGSGLSASNTAIQGGSPKDIAKSAALGAALGGVVPVGAKGVELGAKGAVKVAENAKPLNEAGFAKVPKTTSTEKAPPDFLKPTKKTVTRTPVSQAAEILQVSPKQAEKAMNSGVTPDLNELVNKGLVHMPQPEPDLPATPPHTGDLVPMQTLATANKAFSNKVNVLRKINTPASHALADAVENTDRTKEALRAGYMNQIPTVQRLNNKETSQLFDVVEKKISQKSVSPKVAQAAKEWQKLTLQIHQNAFEQGAIIGNRKNYVPHSYPEGFWNKTRGSQYDSAIQHLMDTNQVNHNSAVQLFKDMSTDAAKRPAWFANFENARLTDLPGYQKNKDSLYKYVEGAAGRTAEAHHLGLDNQIANKLLQNIRLEGGDVTAATHAVGNYLHSADKGAGAKTLRGVRGFFGAARLGKAAISHAGQTSNTIVDAGTGNALKGWGGYLSRNQAAKDFIAKTGVTNPQVLHGYQNQFTSVKGALSKVTAPGLNQIMGVNRSVTALAYKEYGNALAKAGNTAELRKLGVQGDIGKTLTPEQEIQAARSGVNRTMFSSSRASTPTYAETPLGKTIGQYRTAYGYKQTGFIYDRVIKEAAKGNLKPLTRFLAVSAPIAGGTIAFKNKISGNKEGAGGIAMDTAGALGGIPGELALELGRYGKRDLTKAVAGSIAPLAGEAVTGAENVGKALNGNLKPVAREALGLVPIAGSQISKTVLPSKTSSTSSNSSSSEGTTLSAKGNTIKLTKRQTTALSPNELTRWTGLTSAAKKNVQTANPDKYIRDQQLQIQQYLSQGKTVDAFKTAKTVAQTQIYKNFDPNVVQAYGLSSQDFKTLLSQAPSDFVNQLKQLDSQLVNKGIVAKTKFTKSITGSSSSSGSSSTGSRSGTAKIATLKAPSPRTIHKNKLPTIGSKSRVRGIGYKSLGSARQKKVSIA